jgi:hypothetical protein
MPGIYRVYKRRASWPAGDIPVALLKTMWNAAEAYDAVVNAHLEAEHLQAPDDLSDP